jgi:hypothetical protein
LLAVFAAAGCVPPETASTAGGAGGTSADAAAAGSGGSEAGAIGTGGTAAGSGGDGAGPAGSGGVAAGGAGGVAIGSGGSGGRGGTGGGGRGGTGGGGAGRSGSGGSGTGGGRSGTGGGGGTTTCTINAQATLSTAIPTVGIVTWSTDLANVASAEIRFGLTDTGPTMVAPVDLTQASYRTPLLGMKGSRPYVYRIVASSGAGSCTSQDYTITTGAVPSSVPRPTRQVMNAAAMARGFIITCGGVNMMGGGGNVPAYILDPDGDPVWWAAAPPNTSRAGMSWDGKDMYLLALNVQNTGGELRRVSMDGMTTQDNLSGMNVAHHDFTVLPDGGIATFVWAGSGANARNSFVERAASGTVNTIVADMATLYNSSSGFHPNAIHYYQSDNSYTISDRNPNLFVKITRSGQLVWQLGGNNPRGQTFQVQGGTWQVNHGHHMLPNGNFLFFANGPMNGGQPAALEYRLDTSAWTATRVWSYQPNGITSPVLSDVQRLPNGNTLVTFSAGGQIHEVDSSGALLMSLRASSFGYAEFRESLYGPPPR